MMFLSIILETFEDTMCCPWLLTDSCSAVTHPCVLVSGFMIVLLIVCMHTYFVY